MEEKWPNRNDSTFDVYFVHPEGQGWTLQFKESKLCSFLRPENDRVPWGKLPRETTGYLEEQNETPGEAASEEKADDSSSSDDDDLRGTLDRGQQLSLQLQADQAPLPLPDALTPTSLTEGDEFVCYNKGPEAFEMAEAEKYQIMTHIEGLSMGCRIMPSLVCHDVHAEGATQNTLQLQLNISFVYTTLGAAAATWPLRLFIDDVCSTLIHLLSELRKLALDQGTVLEPWVLLLLVSIDVCFDGFHWPNHVSAFARNS